MVLEVGGVVTLGVVGGDLEGTAEGLLLFCCLLQVLVTCVQVLKVHELYSYELSKCTFVCELFCVCYTLRNFKIHKYIK